MELFSNVYLWPILPSPGNNSILTEWALYLWNATYFNHINLSSFLASLWGQTDTCDQGLFCTKFNSKQHLYESFFDAMCIFGSVEPQSEFTFPFIYIVIFQRWVYFEPPSSTLRGDRHMHSLTFLYEIQLRTTFIRSFFWCNAYFWQCSAVNAKIHAFSINHNVNSSGIDRSAIFYDKLSWHFFETTLTQALQRVWYLVLF